jgi:drug/metabolite transporter (DMT)-like permease
METWVLFTLLAALMQSVRTAGQKKLTSQLSPMATTMVRYLFGAPFAAIYLLLAFTGDLSQGMSVSFSNPSFLVYALLASITQIAATVCLVIVLALRNFAVGTVLSKTEAIQAAVFGAIFFSARISLLGWFAVLLGAGGVFIMSFPGNGHRLDASSVGYGLLSGLGFACTALWLRQASLSLEYSFIENAALTLVFTVLVQSCLCLGYVLLKEVQQMKILWQHLPLAIFVGATSCFGSVGWYTAMTFQNAALVRSLGQVELIFAAFITYAVFKEKISPRELLGIGAITASVLILLLAM